MCWLAVLPEVDSWKIQDSDLECKGSISATSEDEDATQLSCDASRLNPGSQSQWFPCSTPWPLQGAGATQLSCDASRLNPGSQSQWFPCSTPWPLQGAAPCPAQLARGLAEISRTAESTVITEQTGQESSLNRLRRQPTRRGQQAALLLQCAGVPLPGFQEAAWCPLQPCACEWPWPWGE